MFETRQTEKNTLIVTLEGNIYSQVLGEFENALMSAANRSTKNLILDAVQLKSIDSSGLNVLISVIKLLKSTQKGDLILFGANETVKKVLTITKLDKFIKLTETEETALQLINQ